MEYPPHGEDLENLERKLICATLVPYAASLLIEKHNLNIDHSNQANNTEIMENMEKARLAPVSTDSDAYEARALILGPVAFDVDKSTVSIRSLYFQANLKSGEIKEEPLEFNIFSILEPDSNLSGIESYMTESREAEPGEYKEIINLLHIAQKSAINPSAFPLDPMMNMIIKDKYLPRLGSMYPTPEKTDTLDLEKSLSAMFDQHANQDEANTSSELAFGKKGDNKSILITKNDCDYEIKIYDEENNKLEIFAVGPFAENMVDEVIDEFSNDVQVREVINMLKTGTLMKGKSFNKVRSAVYRAEEDLRYPKKDQENDEEDGLFGEDDPDTL